MIPSVASERSASRRPGRPIEKISISSRSGGSRSPRLEIAAANEVEDAGDHLIAPALVALAALGGDRRRLRAGASRLSMCAAEAHRTGRGASGSW